MHECFFAENILFLWKKEEKYYWKCSIVYEMISPYFFKFSFYQSGMLFNFWNLDTSSDAKLD